MKNVRVRLQEYQKQANGAEQNLVRYLLEKPEQAAQLTVYQIAEKNFTSPATVVRFCKKVGFSGYREFLAALNHENAVRRQAHKDITTDISPEDGVQDIVEKVTYRNIQALEDTGRLLDTAEVSECVSLMQRAHNIVLFGIGSSLLVARDSYLKFLRLNKPCLCNDDWHSQLLSARNATPQDVGIIISYSGLTEEMIRCAKILKENGVPIIAITRFSETSLTALADHKLYVAANELLVRTAATASRISQLNVVDILFTAYVKLDYEKNMSCLSRNIIRKD